MTIIREFKSIRPNIEHADKVAALPYDVYSSSEARKEVMGKPYSFLHVDRGEIDLPEDVDIYSEEVYQKANDNLNNMVKKNILMQDSNAYLYVYRLTMNGRSQTGLVCCSSIDDYLNGVIKRHELTREDKEIDRIKHVDYCNSNTGPIFLTYKSQNDIDKLIDTWTLNNSPVYDFISEDTIKHQVWVINDIQVINTIKGLFDKVKSTYIADGHHRTASAVKVGLMRRNQNIDYNGNEEFNYFLSVLFPHNQLFIMDYNRVVKDLNGLSQEEFFQKLKVNFTIEKIGNPTFKPDKKGTIGMYINNQWYKLTIKSEILNENDPVLSLDVSILQNYVLTSILGIKDIRNDKRIDFVGGIRGLKELERRCSEDMKIAFAMYPTSIEELMNISDCNKLMPPKSTWFEPKLRSGLFIHSLT
ncbi:MAG: DUF1015 domain-containing protein [Eubacteriaceae bacterium]